MSKIKILAEQLATIAAEKKELEVKEGAIKESLLQEMIKEGVEKDKYEFGTVSIGRRKTYIYSEVVKKLEDKVKIKKDEEVKLGIAEEKVTEYITFRGVTE